jgi:glycosyltransferase involved in cell wall biosynthesis
MSSHHKKKILVIVGSLDIGGTERGIVRNFSRLNYAQFNVTVATYRQSGPLASVLADSGVTVLENPLGKQFYERFPLGKWLKKVDGRGLSTLQRMVWLRSVIKAHNPDIIHAFLPSAYFLAMMAHLLTPGNRKFFVTRPCLNYYHQGNKLFKILETKFLHKYADLLIGNTKAILQNFAEEGVPAEKMRLLYNGLDVQEFHGDRHDYVANKTPLIITAVANLHSYKGYDDLLNAAVILRNSTACAWHLKIAGQDKDGNLARFQHFITRHDLQGYVSFLGEFQDIKELLAESDVFVHPSHTEGLPNAVIEAMSAGLPIVATSVGGIPELVEQDRNGYLVPAHNPSDLASALMKLLESAENRKAFGQTSLQYAWEKFDLSMSVKNYEALYA